MKHRPHVFLRQSACVLALDGLRQMAHTLRCDYDDVKFFS